MLADGTARRMMRLAWLSLFLRFAGAFGAAADSAPSRSQPRPSAEAAASSSRPRRRDGAARPAAPESARRRSPPTTPRSPSRPARRGCAPRSTPPTSSSDRQGPDRGGRAIRLPARLCLRRIPARLVPDRFLAARSTAPSGRRRRADAARRTPVARARREAGSRGRRRLVPARRAGGIRRRTTRSAGSISKAAASSRIAAKAADLFEQAAARACGRRARIRLPAPAGQRPRQERHACRRLSAAGRRGSATWTRNTRWPGSTSRASASWRTRRRRRAGSARRRATAMSARRSNTRIMLFNGRGVQKDEAVAARWFPEAADADNPLAQVRLARLFAEGRGVEKDPAEAARWYLIAKEPRPRRRLHGGMAQRSRRTDAADGDRGSGRAGRARQRPEQAAAAPHAAARRWTIRVE